MYLYIHIFLFHVTCLYIITSSLRFILLFLLFCILFRYLLSLAVENRYLGARLAVGWCSDPECNNGGSFHRFVRLYAYLFIRAYAWLLQWICVCVCTILWNCDGGSRFLYATRVKAISFTWPAFLLPSKEIQ